jgi:hypothetical protein
MREATPLPCTAAYAVSMLVHVGFVFSYSLLITFYTGTNTVKSLFNEFLVELLSLY